MILHVLSLVTIMALGSTAWHYRQRSKTLAAQREENARDKQTIVVLRAEIESVRSYALGLYLELQETGRDAARFRFLHQFFEKEASALASRVDALSAARLAAEKKNWVLGWSNSYLDGSSREGGMDRPMGKFVYAESASVATSATIVALG